MGDVSMPGGWTLSMMWMRMPGQTWPGAAAMFLAMWTAMTAVMMAPSLAQSLWRYHREAVRAAATSPNWLTALVSTSYLLTWTIAGVIAFALGASLAAVALRFPVLARVGPVTAGVVVVAAGVLQRSAWKARHLASCREWPPRVAPYRAGHGEAWQYGLHLGVHCACSCAPLMAVGVVLGVMNVAVMGLLAVAVSAERLAPAGARVARGAGTFVMVVGTLLVIRAAAMG